MYHVFKQMNVRNRAYVVDPKGNKMFYGTVYQCRKFIKYMEGDESNDTTERDSAAIRENRDSMDQQRKAVL